jgi:hypothetical protein
MKIPLICQTQWEIGEQGACMSDMIFRSNPVVRTCHLLKHYSFIKQMFLEAGIIIIAPDFSLN